MQQAAAPMAEMMPPDPLAAPLFDVELRRKKEVGRVRVACVPPEEFLIDRSAVALEDAKFSGHRCMKTLSDLIEMGFDKDTVMSLPGDGDDELDLTDERRERLEDQEWENADALDTDPSMREVEVTEAYIRVDYDGDGLAELRKVTMVGKTILENEEVDDHPFATLTPIPMPHVFFGRSIADQTMDVQLIKSTLVRQMLDNLYLTNSPEREVLDGAANMDDLLSSRPGGIKRVKAMGSIREIVVPFVAKESFPMLQYYDQEWERRTGAFRHAEGPDANALAATATGANMLENTAQRRVKLIARVFAETGVKRAFKRILQLVCRHQDREKVIRLRNQWVPMDPRHWDAGMDLSVTVGLGTGNKDQQIAQATNLLGIQSQIVQAQGGVNGPLVTWKEVYNTASKVVEASGLKTPEPYFVDPESPEAQQREQQKAANPPPDPKMIEVQMKAQADQQKAAMDFQLDQAKTQAAQQADAARMQFEQALAERRMENEFALKSEQIAAEMGLKREQLIAELQLKREQFAEEMQLRRTQAAADTSIKASVATSRVAPGGDPG